MLSQLSWYVLQGDAKPRRKRFGETSIRCISHWGRAAVIKPMIGRLLVAYRWPRTRSPSSISYQKKKVDKNLHKPPNLRILSSATSFNILHDGVRRSGLEYNFGLRRILQFTIKVSRSFLRQSPIVVPPLS